MSDGMIPGDTRDPALASLVSRACANMLGEVQRMLTADPACDGGVSVKLEIRKGRVQAVVEYERERRVVVYQGQSPRIERGGR